MQEKIVVNGAREHNLKNIGLEIPKNRIELKIPISLCSTYIFNSSLPWEFGGAYAR